MQQNQKQQKLKPKLEIPNAETADKDKFDTGGILNEVLYREAPPEGSNPYPLI